MNYADYLQSPVWDVLRKRAYQRANHKCELCAESAAHVHHVKYPKNFSSDALDNLVVVCEGCHKKLHGIRDISVPEEIWQKAISQTDGDCHLILGTHIDRVEPIVKCKLACETDGSICGGFDGYIQVDEYLFIRCFYPDWAAKQPPNTCRHARP
jgi:hypothetical protein